MYRDPTKKFEVDPKRIKAEAALAICRQGVFNRSSGGRSSTLAVSGVLEARIPLGCYATKTLSAFAGSL